MSSESDLPLGERATVADSALDWSFARASGPGGQNVNKVNTKAELRVAIRDLRGLDAPAIARLRRLAGKHLVGESIETLQITVQSERTQARNRAIAIERLAELVVAAQVVPKTRRPTRPSRAAKRRRLDDKRHRADTKSRRKELD